MRQPRTRWVVVFACLSVALVGSSVEAGAIIHVDDDAAAAGDGLSWGTAYRFLQDALAFASDPANGVTEVRVAQGTYKPDGDEANPDGTADRQASFELPNGLALLGGYAGLGASDPDARDSDLYETILSGDLLGNDGPDFQNNEENSHNIVKAISLGTDSLLDGFTLTGGNADGTGKFSVSSRGGGIYIGEGSLTVASCCFTANFAETGAGLFNSGGNLTAMSCTFVGNTAHFSGGGMTSVGGTPTLSNCGFQCNSATGAFNTAGGGLLITNTQAGTLTACEFIDNTAKEGGGLSVHDSILTFSACTFLNNASESLGGAVYSEGGNPLTFLACEFVGNSSLCGGAVSDILGLGGMLTFEGCVFSDNQASCGGVLFNLFGTRSLFRFCEITNNSATGGGGGVVLSTATSFLTMISCSVTGNTASVGGGAIGHRIVLTLIDCVFAENAAGEEGGAIVSTALDWTIINCDFRKNSAGVGGALKIGEDNQLLVNCTFSQNTAVGSGGAIHKRREALDLVNCTFAGNSAFFAGGGVAAVAVGQGVATSITMTNTILWGNNAALGPQVALTRTDDTDVGTLAVHYSDVQGAEPSIYVEESWTVDWGDGNLDIDPLFLDPDGPDDDPMTVDDNDYRLAPGSPCIDAADNTAVPVGTITDLAGQPRFFDDPDTTDTGNPPGESPIVDMGAYEFHLPCSADLNRDGVVNVLDLIDLLLCFGQPALPPCETSDLNNDGGTNHLDLIVLLRAFGTTCP